MGFKEMRDRIATLSTDPVVEEIEQLMGSALTDDSKGFSLHQQDALWTCQ